MSFNLNRSYLTLPGGIQPSTDATNENDEASPSSTSETEGNSSFTNDDTLEEGKLIEEETEKGHS